MLFHDFAYKITKNKPNQLSSEKKYENPDAERERGG